MIASLGTRYLNFYKTKKLLNAYPAEYFVRIFLGTYPSLKLNREAFSRQRLLEVGCGDGRNLILFSRLGFETHGTEIDDGMSQIVDSQELKVGYHVIANDPYQIRNGQVFRRFSSEGEIVESLGQVFTNFRLATIDDNCFGQLNKWHIIVCDKK